MIGWWNLDSSVLFNLYTVGVCWNPFQLESRVQNLYPKYHKKIFIINWDIILLKIYILNNYKNYIFEAPKMNSELSLQYIWLICT